MTVPSNLGDNFTCGDKVVRVVFPGIYIFSMDIEEQLSFLLFSYCGKLTNYWNEVVHYTQPGNQSIETMSTVPCSELTAECAWSL